MVPTSRERRMTNVVKYMECLMANLSGEKPRWEGKQVWRPWGPDQGMEEQPC